MKVIEIIGDNYFGNFKIERKACRGIVIEDGKILASLDTVHDAYMIPGGGLEDNESIKECCIREVEEETGYLVKTGECFLEIDEYYEDCKYVSYYFKCDIIGKGNIKLTNQEIEVGLMPKWVNKDELVDIFSKYDKWIGIDETGRGLYLREYNALKYFFEV